MVSRYLRSLLLATLLLTTAASANAQSSTDHRLQQDIHKCPGENNSLYGVPSKTAVICQNLDARYLSYEQYTQNSTGGHRWRWSLTIFPQESTGQHFFTLATSDAGEVHNTVLFTKWVPGKAYFQERFPGLPIHVELTERFIRTHAAEFDQFVTYYARWHDSHFTGSSNRQDCWSRSARGGANPLDCAEAEGLPIN